MLKKLTVKAARRGLSVELRQGSVLELPFDDGEFTLVTTAFMLLYLTPEEKQRGPGRDPPYPRTWRAAGLPEQPGRDRRHLPDPRGMGRAAARSRFFRRAGRGPLRRLPIGNGEAMNNQRNLKIYRRWPFIYDAWIPVLYGRARRRTIVMLELRSGERSRISRGKNPKTSGKEANL